MFFKMVYVINLDLFWKRVFSYSNNIELGQGVR
jgi:hypothetical protein